MYISRTIIFKGDLPDIDNYRPISPLPTLHKLFFVNFRKEISKSTKEH